MDKILIHPVRTLKKDLLVSALYMIGFALIAFPPMVWIAALVHKIKGGPHESIWNTYVFSMTALLPGLILFLSGMSLWEYRKLKWYPYFFSPDKHFFLKIKSVSFEEIRQQLESQTWRLLKQTGTSISFKFKGSGGGYHDRDWLVAQRNFTWRSTDVEITRFDINDGVLIYVCFRQTGIGRRGGGQTSRKTLGARVCLVDELFPDAEFYNQKWQRIDRQWNVINANSLQGAPIVEFAKPKKIMGWNLD